MARHRRSRSASSDFPSLVAFCGWWAAVGTEAHAATASSTVPGLVPALLHGSAQHELRDDRVSVAHTRRPAMGISAIIPLRAAAVRLPTRRRDDVTTPRQ